MAREHAAIRLDMWSDDDYRARSFLAQWLYEFLMTTATLSYAGVADWRPPRIAGHASDLTPEMVATAARELEEYFFVVTDPETEEILVRSFLRHDGLLKKPNVTKAMVTDFKAVVSMKLRAVIVHELQRLSVEFPNWSAWGSQDIQSLMLKPSFDPKGRVRNEIPKGSIKGSQVDASLLTPSSLLLTPDSTHLTPSTNAVRDDVLRLCNLLQDLIVANGSKKPTIGKTWTDAARLMLVADGRAMDAAERLMRWCQVDEFWKVNVLSMPTFRKKYDQIRLKAERERTDRLQQGGRRSKEDQIDDVRALGRRMQDDEDGMAAISA